MMWKKMRRELVSVDQDKSGIGDQGWWFRSPSDMSGWADGRSIVRRPEVSDDVLGKLVLLRSAEELDLAYEVVKDIVTREVTIPSLVDKHDQVE